MHGPAAATGLEDCCLDILGQQPLLNLYTQLCFCFPVAGASSQAAIISTLTDGLERLAASFPWLAGRVVNEGSSEGNSGVFKIKSLDRTPPLVVRDLRHDPSTPTMDALRQADFPIRILDESILAPRRTIPGKSVPDVLPVFLVQATFITGGLLLTFLAQHNAMDMTGQGHFISLLSRACHSEEFARDDLVSGNLARHNLIPLLKDDSYRQCDSLLARQIAKPAIPASQPAPPPHPPKCTWANFTFSAAHLAELKSRATTAVSSGYVSTDDALSAFVWQSISRARIPRLGPATPSTFARAVNVRRYLAVPQTYPGLVQNMTYHTSTLQELTAAEESLGVVSSRLRSAVDPETSNLGFDTRALATFLHRTPDKSVVSFTATLDPSSDVMLSSWAQLDSYGLDFGLGLGKPEAVRRPRFDPCEGLIYFLPKSCDGEIAVAICLRDEDMERLKADDEFTRYGRYVG